MRFSPKEGVSSTIPLYHEQISHWNIFCSTFLKKPGRIYGKIEKSIDIECPISTVYNQWTQFEEFPRFMKGVKKVTQLDDQRLHWEAEIAGKDKEWDARITDQVPDQLIAWQSEGGEYTSGTVNFAPVDENRTHISLQLLYDPEGFVEKAGDTFGIVSSRVEGDLERFKEFIEKRCQETGAWRGTIRE